MLCRWCHYVLQVELSKLTGQVDRTGSGGHRSLGEILVLNYTQVNSQANVN